MKLLGAGLRELHEETGLKLEPEQVSPTVLGLWEVRESPEYLLITACCSYLHRTL